MSVLEHEIPHSIDAEQSVIGAILLKSDALDEIASLKPEHFYVAAHREIYSLMVEMSKGGREIDVITLSEVIADKRLDQLTGGLSYLGELASNVPSAANIKRYAEIVQNKSIERELLAAVEDIRAVVSSAGPTRDKLNTAQAKIMAIAETRQAKQPRKVGDAMEDYMATLTRRHKGEARGLSTGLSSLDHQLGGGLQDGNLIIVAGRPAMGKSAFTNTIAINVASDDPANVVALFSMEMTESEQIDRMVATIGRVSLQDVLEANLEGDAGNRITYAFSRLQELPVVIDEQGGVSIHELMSKCRQIKRKHGLRLIIVDALGLMDYDSSRAVSALGDITRSLKAFAKEMNVPVILLCQLSRKCEERTDKRPVLSDLRDSGNIEQDSDVVLMVYRDEYYNPNSPDTGVAEIIARKVRQGKVGTVPMAFIGDQTRFAVLEREWSQPETNEVARPKKKGFSG